MGFLEEGGKQFGKKNVETGELAGERSCQGIRRRLELYSKCFINERQYIEFISLECLNLYQDLLQKETIVLGSSEK